MAGLKENMPHAGFDADEDDFARTPPTPVSPAALREVLKQHGDRFEPILAVLRDQPWKELVTSRDMMDSLSAQGLEQSERTLRLHLAEMAEAGLIQRHGRRGYRLTEAGTEVTRELTVSRRIGSILYRMEETACQLTFDLNRRQGLVSINAYVIPQTLLGTLIDEVESVFKAGLAVGQRVLFALPGDDILGREVPEGHIGLGTMCSLTLASMLMRRGVPTHAIFGGLLHVINGKPEHFLEMIRYDATSLSPNEVFIRANLTSVSAAAKRGVGAITASFRELPMSALPAARIVMKECEQAEFPGIMCVGRPGQQLLNIPVHEGRVGMILSTGLNPLASLWEHDRSAPNRGMPGLLLESSRPMVGPAPYEQLISYQEFCVRATAFIATQQQISQPHRSKSTTSSVLHP